MNCTKEILKIFLKDNSSNSGNRIHLWITTAKETKIIDEQTFLRHM